MHAKKPSARVFTMLTSTFLHLPRIGPRLEQTLWSQGIDSWWAFLDAQRISGISPRRKIGYDMAIRRATHALEAEDSTYFAKNLPTHAVWRLWPHFKDDAVFLDIETSGYYGDVTVVGLYSEDGVHTFVANRNLDRETFSRVLSRYKLIVTFNGASFDLPVLSRYFNMTFEHPHIDLRPVCNHLGLRGGLKSIERQIGIKRPEELDGMDGYEAVILWDLYRRTGEERYLERLVDYNAQDIINLKPLAEFAIPRLWKAIRNVKNHSL